MQESEEKWSKRNSTRYEHRCETYQSHKKFDWIQNKLFTGEDYLEVRRCKKRALALVKQTPSSISSLEWESSSLCSISSSTTKLGFCLCFLISSRHTSIPIVRKSCSRTGRYGLFIRNFKWCHAANGEHWMYFCFLPIRDIGVWVPSFLYFESFIPVPTKGQGSTTS